MPTVHVESQYQLESPPVTGSQPVQFSLESYQIQLAEIPEDPAAERRELGALMRVRATKDVSQNLYDRLTEFLAKPPAPKVHDLGVSAMKPGERKSMVLSTGHDPALAEWGDTTSAELHDVTARIARVLRWQLGRRDGSHNPIQGGRHSYSRYSLDGVVWSGIPSKGTLIEIGADSTMPLQGFKPENIGPFISSVGDEPLCHILLREALLNTHTNPRSSVLLAVAAAEIGLKACISQLVPEAKWLVFNVPSPPIERILKDGFAELPKKSKLGGVLPKPPMGVIEELRKLITIRNNLAHQGTLQLSADRLKGFLDTVQDLLWMFDVFVGHTWAESHLSKNTRKLITQEIAN